MSAPASVALRAWRPRRPEPLGQQLRRSLQRDALLGQGVPITDRDRAVVERLVVDRERPRRPDLVLAPVALADRRGVVVLGGHRAAQLFVERPRLLDER